jgi:AMMECR1 domain-containing protein
MIALKCLQGELRMKKFYQIPGVLISGLLLILLIVALFALLPAGRKRPVFFSDRHSGSYPIIEEFTRNKGPVTLILFDYHHDMGPGPDIEQLPSGITSYNWLGALAETGRLNRIYWVSGRELELPNINSRREWLKRKIASDPPGIAEIKDSIVTILDFPDLMSLSEESIPGTLVISLDLDILIVDPGDDPDLFLEEILNFIIDTDPALVSVALSSAYQKSPVSGWRWFATAYKRLSAWGAPSVAGGEVNPVPEGLEEKEAWDNWERRRTPIDFGASFAPGSELWEMAPLSVWETFLDNPPDPLDEGMRKMLKRISSSMSVYRDLKADFPEKEILRLSRIAADAIESRWMKGPPGAQELSELSEEFYLPGEEKIGIAVRLVSGVEDRGCMAYYAGVSDPETAVELAAVSAAFHDPRYPSVSRAEKDELDIELTVFGEFQPIDDPFNFIPGLDSLLVEKEGDRTLLQASIAAERNLSQYQFLETVTRKASLPPGAWKTGDIRIFKTPTLFLRRPFRGGM